MSFLQNIQQLIEDEPELSSYAADVSSHSVIEELPPMQVDSVESYYTGNLQELEDLIEVFFTSVGELEKSNG